MYPNVDIVDQIKAVRKKKGITQAELAIRSGLKPAALARIENHRMSPTAKMLGRILDALGMKLALAEYEPIEKDLVLCLDMHGCPNRCKHCWLGELPNGQIEDDYATFLAGLFRPYFRNLTFYSWLREPDFCPNYKWRWEEDNRLSSIKPERFELASFYRIARDPEYVKWLKEVGTKKVQFTFFGLEKTTDEFVGRAGAYGELLRATKVLLENRIEPRWQIFLYQSNKDEAVALLDIAKSMGVNEIIAHEGSCDGNNRKLYDIRINKSEIPEVMKPYYLDYPNILSERECVEMLRDDRSSYLPHNESEIVLYVTADLNVYYNFTSPSPAWRIGNMRDDDIDLIVRKAVMEDIPALTLSKAISIGELARRYGDMHSDRVFSLDDYKMYLLNNYLDETYNCEKELDALRASIGVDEQK